MKDVLARIKWFEWLIVLLIVLGLFGSISRMELRAEEPRRAVVAMEMVLGDNWLIPKIQGWPYYNKPPFFNWVLGGVFSIAGEFSEPWVRLPSLLSLLLTAFLVFRLLANYENKKTGFIGALLLLTSVDIFFYGAVDAGEMDLFLTLLVFLQGSVIFYCGNRQNWFLLFLFSYIITGIAILTKGLPPLILQGLILIGWLFYIKQFGKLFSWQHLLGLIACFLIVGVYFLLYEQKGDAFTYLSQLADETTEHSAFEVHSKDVLLNILQSPLQLFYISLPAAALLLYLLNKKVRKSVRHNQLFIFSFIFTLINVVPFYISPATANRYLYPAFPFIAIMSAIVYTKALPAIASSGWLVKYAAFLWVVFGLAIARIAYNMVGIPYQEKNSESLIYRALTSKLLRYSGGKPIYLTGYPEEIIADPSIYFLRLKPDTAYIPPLIPYQLPYYITKATGTVMRYDTVPQKGLYYLTPVDFLKKKKVKICYSFFDEWRDRQLALVIFQ